jgi:hypothetical protein
MWCARYAPCGAHTLRTNRMTLSEWLRAGSARSMRYALHPDGCCVLLTWYEPDPRVVEWHEGVKREAFSSGKGFAQALMKALRLATDESVSKVDSSGNSMGS